MAILSKKVMNFAYGMGAAVVIVGALFKLMHWPGAGPMLIFGLLTEALIFGLSAFEISKQRFNSTLLLIPFIMISIHFAYGIGTIKGWIFGFDFKKNYFLNDDKLKKL